MGSPAYHYGVLIGTFQRAAQEFARQVSAGFEAASRPRREPDVEAIRVARYRRRIEVERRTGLASVHAYAQRVRRELGLPEGEGR